MEPDNLKIPFKKKYTNLLVLEVNVKFFIRFIDHRID